MDTTNRISTYWAENKWRTLPPHPSPAMRNPWIVLVPPHFRFFDLSFGAFQYVYLFYSKYQNGLKFFLFKMSSRILCPLCDDRVKDYNVLRSHITESHQIPCELKELRFPSFIGMYNNG